MIAHHIDPDGCQKLRVIAQWFGCRSLLSQGRTMVLGFGRPLNPNDPNPKELPVMAIGNIGQRIPLIATFLQADGTTPASVDGPPVLTSSDPAIAEIRDVDGQSYAYLLAQGSTEITLRVDADRSAGVRELTAIGQIIVNDPATEAQIVELDLGPAEDVPIA